MTMKSDDSHDCAFIEELLAWRTEQVYRLREVLEALLPYIPKLDASPARYSAHAQAAGAARKVLDDTAPEVETKP